MSSVFISSVTVVLFGAFVTAQYYNAGNMAGIGCVITGDKLFSHGNYIRDLKAEEVEELQKYKTDIAAFQKAIGEVYAQAEVYNGTAVTLPSLPPRPTIPAFCTGNETTLYVLGSCTVQNHKVYVSGNQKSGINYGNGDRFQLDNDRKFSHITSPNSRFLY
ncbi:unnamed protein product [Bursaphelenchus xylophilus]|uniref:(pine wood nematode) hypothetical protein n=1 Tax=Bursaphelenchus xylophilus TaxID=6326 RepID=A0A1I7SW67_BURXY|nr:unnamed protein product [Bursaphelenchus xylophilus]CAG9098907.1 unnamed protein product [Bursaphelenchus xylophilus]